MWVKTQEEGEGLGGRNEGGAQEEREQDIGVWQIGGS
jgi:hypothetical protein